MLEDEVYVWKLKRGDEQALRQIYEKYKDDLLSVAVGLLNEAAAGEDILHNVFISFVRNIKNFHLHGSLKNHLIRCVVNRIRDRLNSRMYKVVGLESTGPLSSDSGGPAEAVLQSEQFQIIDDALSKLPLPQREVVVLHLQGGMKFREIAELQSVPINTIQSRYLYGLEKLRSLLNGELIE